MQTYEKTVDLFAARASEFLGERITVIVELGARDCKETLRFNELFPASKIYTFECNPDTLPLCRTAVESMSNIVLVEKAVTNIDGEIKFYQIDREKTQTTWEDGNPGASSLLKSSGKYPLEHYVQKEIVVPAITLKTFMKERNIAEIDLLWMDLQGAEMQVFDGLGSRINDLKLIHTEVEFFEIYMNQPLFEDIKHYLNRKGFFFIGFTNRGDFSSDAMFINRRYLGKGFFRYFFIDKLVILKLRLLCLWNTGIYRKMINMLRLIYAVCVKHDYRRWYLSKPIQSARSYLWKLMHPSSGDIPIDILITAVEKDFDILPLVVEAARRNIKDPIAGIYVVGPASERLKKICVEHDCHFVDEKDVLPFSKEEIEYKVNGIDRAGWLFQQFIKLNGDKICIKDYFLTLDADTVLVRPQVFLSGGVSVLLYSDEYHKPYFEMYRHLLIEDSKCPVSFVSHQMIFEKKKLIEMKRQIEKLHACNWYKAVLSNLDRNESSGFSEFETYGQYMYLHHRRDIDLQYFFNLSSKRENIQDVKHIEELNGKKYRSVSFHSWNQ